MNHTKLARTSNLSPSIKTDLASKAGQHKLGEQNDFSVIDEVIHSPGRPLIPETREFMEQRFGHDFGQVRVHDDQKAAQSADLIAAHAYTVADKIVFNKGRYAPNSDQGRNLLAHELAHVVQQSRGGSTPCVTTSRSLESDAQRAAMVATQGSDLVKVAEASSVGIACEGETEEERRTCEKQALMLANAGITLPPELMIPKPAPFPKTPPGPAEDSIAKSVRQMTQPRPVAPRVGPIAAAPPQPQFIADSPKVHALIDKLSTSSPQELEDLHESIQSEPDKTRKSLGLSKTELAFFRSALEKFGGDRSRFVPIPPEVESLAREISGLSASQWADQAQIDKVEQELGRLHPVDFQQKFHLMDGDYGRIVNYFHKKNDKTQDSTEHPLDPNIPVMDEVMEPHGVEGRFVGVTHIGPAARIAHEKEAGQQAVNESVTQGFVVGLGGMTGNAHAGSPGFIDPEVEQQYGAPLEPRPEQVAAAEPSMPVDMNNPSSMATPPAKTNAEPSVKGLLSEGNASAASNGQAFVKNTLSHGENVVESEVLQNFIPKARQMSAKSAGFDAFEGATTKYSTVSQAKDGTLIVEESITGGNWYQIKGVSEARTDLIKENVQTAIERAVNGLNSLRANPFERTGPGVAYKLSYGGPPDKITIFLRLEKGAVTKELADAAQQAISESPYKGDLPAQVVITIVGH